jgi:hypothetical protein
MPKAPHYDQDETIRLMLSKSGRSEKAAPLRRSFVQSGPQKSPTPGPLHRMLRAHDERAFDLFLLHRALVSAEPWDISRDARIWARTLGLPTPKDTGASAVSKTWARLDVKYQLIQKSRRGRLTNITALDEAGTGIAYSYPGGGKGDPYFKVPFAYWTSDDHWYRELSFPAKVMLMISLSVKPGSALPEGKLPRWYGVSADSGGRGLRELVDSGILAVQNKRRQDLLSPAGYVLEHRYTPTGVFEREWKAASLATVTPIHAGAVS